MAAEHGVICKNEMKCPECKKLMGQPLVGNVVIDFCQSCRVVWVTEEKLYKAIESNDTATYSNFDMRDYVKLATYTSRNNICPNCESSHFTKSNVKGDEIGMCSACSGIFFGNGSFERIFPSVTLPKAIDGWLKFEIVFWVVLIIGFAFYTIFTNII